MVLRCAELRGSECDIAFGAIQSPPDEAPLVVASIDKLMALGWQPEVSLEQGVADYFSYFDSEDTEIKSSVLD